MTYLNQSTFYEIVELLVPHMTAHNDRRAFIAQALYTSEELRNQIDFSGSPHSFTTLLVEECVKFGSIETDKLAVVALLDELYGHVGKEEQEQIEKLIIHIKTLNSNVKSDSHRSNNILPRQPRRKPRPGLYDWNRLWYPRYSDNPTFQSAEKLRTFFHASSFTDMSHLKDLEDIPCLILLGEPGLGKTESLRTEYDQIINTYGEDSAIFIDLEPADSSQYIKSYIFEHKKYKSWQIKGTRFHIFLDSLDRTQISKEQVIQIIITELQNSDISNLSLRIACRDLDWSFKIADNLDYLWQSKMPKDDKSEYQDRLEETDQVRNKKDVQVYQLAPLTRDDLVVAARANEVDSRQFLKVVSERQVSNLAQIPLILEFMIQRFKSTKDIGSNRHQIYREACQQLCETYSADSQQKYNNDFVDRLQYAQIIMSVLVLGNKYAITNNSVIANTVPTTMHFSTLTMSSEKINKKIANETLSTALFKGTDFRTWIHRSVAEYLTAEYLTNSNCDSDHIIEILTDNKGQFAQQIIEVVRWLIEIGPQSISNRIADVQPELFLSMDLSAINTKTFLAVINNLLNLDDQHKYIDLMNYIRQQRKPIPDPQLSQLMRSHLTKENNSKYKRRFVIELVRTFAIPNLDKELLEIVFDKDEDYTLRRFAAGSIYDNSTDEIKQELKPFIYGDTSDPSDELKGYALLSLWPDFLTAKELFSALTPPKRSSWAGSYALFINPGRIIDHLEPEDLTIALEWVSQQPSDHEQRFIFRNLTQKIMQKAWDYFHLPSVQKSFAVAALNRITNHDYIFGSGDTLTDRNSNTVQKYSENLIADTEKRRQFIILLSQEIMSQNIKPSVLIYGKQKLFLKEDFEWVIDQFESSIGNKEENFWSEILNKFFFWILPFLTVKNVELLHSLRGKSEILAKLTEDHFEFQSFDDPEVIEKRQNTQEQKRQRAEFEASTPTPHNPPPNQRIQNSLQKIEGGNHSQWVQLVFDMLLETPTGQYFWHDTYPDIRLFPGWKEANQETQNRIINAAQNFLLNQQEISSENDDDEHWLSTTRIPYVELTGYLAVFLLSTQERDYVTQLSSSVWHRWADSITWYPAISGIRTDREELDKSNQKLQYWLIKQVINKASVRTLSALDLLIEKEDRSENSHLYILRKFTDAWGQRLETYLIEKLGADLSETSKVDILEFMLNHDSEKAATWAQNLVKNEYTKEANIEIVIGSIVALMRYASEASWTIIWEAITYSDKIGISVVERVAGWHDQGSTFLTWLKEDEIADFYIWLQRKYPSSEDPDIDGMHTVSSRESIGNWRKNIHTYLRNKKTRGAVAALEKIAECFPDIAHIQYARVEAQRGLSEIEWTPASPQDVINLQCAPEKRTDDVTDSQNTDDKSDTNWIAIITLITAIIAIIASIYEPTIRDFIGLSNESPSAVPTISSEATEETTLTIEPSKTPGTTSVPTMLPEEANQSEVTEESENGE